MHTQNDQHFSHFSPGWWCCAWHIPTMNTLNIPCKRFNHKLQIPGTEGHDAPRLAFLGAFFVHSTHIMLTARTLQLVLSTYLSVYSIGRSFETFEWVPPVTYMPIPAFFCILHNVSSVGRRCIKPYSPWEHFPSSIWCNKEAPPLEHDSHDTYLCQLCAHKETSECCQCHLFFVQ